MANKSPLEDILKNPGEAMAKRVAEDSESSEEKKESSSKKSSSSSKKKSSSTKTTDKKPLSIWDINSRPRNITPEGALSLGRGPINPSRITNDDVLSLGRGPLNLNTSNRFTAKTVPTKTPTERFSLGDDVTKRNNDRFQSLIRERIINGNERIQKEKELVPRPSEPPVAPKKTARDIIEENKIAEPVAGIAPDEDAYSFSKRVAREQAQADEEKRARKESEARTNSINIQEKTKRENARNEFFNGIRANKTYDDFVFYPKEDLVDLSTYTLTKEDAIKKFGWANPELFGDKDSIEIPNNFDDYNYYVTGQDAFFEDYKNTYGVDYNEDTKVTNLGTGEYSFGHYRILDEMDENQLKDFFYIYGRYGEEKAMDYFSSSIVDDEGYQSRVDAEQAYLEAKEFAKEDPVTAAIWTPIADITTDGLNLMRMAFGGKEEVSGEKGIAYQQAGRREGLIEAWSPYITENGAVLATMFLSTVDDLVIGAVFGGGPIGDMIEGYITGTTDKRMEQLINDTVGIDGANQEMIFSGLFDAIASPMLGKAGKKLGGNILNKLPLGSKKRIIAETAWNALTSAGIGVTRGGLDIVANEIVMGNNSNYDIYYNNNIQSGMSEKDATWAAVKDAYINPVISSAVSLGFIGTIRGLPNTLKVNADFTKRGKNIVDGVIKASGLPKDSGKLLDTDDIAEALIARGKYYDENSLAGKNAKLLDEYLSKGKKITKSQIGAQDFLNQMAEYDFARYSEGINKLTGVTTRIDPTIDLSKDDGQYVNGEARLGTSPSDDLLNTAKHEYNHGLQAGAAEAYKVYTDMLESNATFKGAVARVKDSYKAQGRTISDEVAKMEAAAEIGRRIMPKTAEDLQRLERRVEGNTTFYDDIHGLLRGLKNLMDKTRKSKFVDEKTGFTATFDEVYRMTKALEDALTKVDKSKIGGSDNMYRIVRNVKDKAGNLYKEAVLLDTKFFNGISPHNWGTKLKKYVENRSDKNPFILPITDENGVVQVLQFAGPKDRMKTKGGNTRHVNSELYKTNDNISKLAVIHIDEVVDVSVANNPYYSSPNKGQWIDDNGWLHRKSTVINNKNGDIYEIMLDIAKARDGRHILYATKGKTKKIGNVDLNSITNNVRGSRQNTYSPKTISQTPPNVNPNSNNSNSSRIKDQTDVMKYGRNIADDIKRFASQRGLGLYKVLEDPEIKSSIERAYALYEEGKTGAGYEMLRQTGAYLEAKSKGKTAPREITKMFADTFEELYIRGRNNKTASGDYKEYESDTKELGLNVPQTTAKLLAAERASMRYEDRLVTERILREAYTELKYTGDETRARELLRPAAQKIVDNAKSFEGDRKYIDNKTESVEGVLDRMIEAYKDEQPASRYGKDEIIAEDNRKYGKDIESVARGVAISNLKEGDAKKIGNVIRNSIDTILGEKDYDIRDIEERVGDTIAEITASRQLSPLEKSALAETLNYEIIEAVKRNIGQREAVANETIRVETEKVNSQKEAGYKGELEDSPEYAEAKAELEWCDAQKENLQLMFGDGKSKYKISSPGKTFFRLFGDETPYTEAFHGELKSRLGEMVYRAISEEEVAEHGINYVRSHDNLDTYTMLQDKSQWDRMDMGVAAALAAQFCREGNYDMAADVCVMAQQFATKGGQVSQAMRLFYVMTPEGKIAYWIRKEKNKIDADLSKTKTPESNKELIDKLRNEYNEKVAEVDNYLKSHDTEHKNICDKEDALRKDLAELGEIEKRYEAELEKRRRASEREKYVKWQEGLMKLRAQMNDNLIRISRSRVKAENPGLKGKAYQNKVNEIYDELKNKYLLPVAGESEIEFVLTQAEKIDGLEPFQVLRRYKEVYKRLAEIEFFEVQSKENKKLREKNYELSLREEYINKKQKQAEILIKDGKKFKADAKKAKEEYEDLLRSAEEKAEEEFRKATEGFTKKELEIEKDIRKNQDTMRKLRKEARKLKAEREANINNYLMVNNDKYGVYVKAKSSSWFKLKKTGADGEDLKLHLDAVLDEMGIEHISQGDFTYFRELIGAIDDMETTDELLDIIMDMSKRRNTAQFGRTEEIRKRLSKFGYIVAGKHIESGYNMLADVLNEKAGVMGKPQLSVKGDDGYKIEHINLDPDSKEYNLLKSALKTVGKDYGIDTLKDIATQQVYGIISDLDSRTTAGKAKTMMHIAQLLNARTIGRNILATAGFSGVDTITNNFAYLLERTHNFVRGNGFTGDSVGWEPIFDKAIKDAAAIRRNMAFVEQALNVNMLDSNNSRSGAPAFKRQFTKGIGASLERMLGYALYVPDENYKGAIGERVRQAMDGIFKDREINLSMVDEMSSKFMQGLDVVDDDTTDYAGIFGDALRKQINKGGITAENLPDIEDSIREGIKDLIVPKGIFDKTTGTKTNFATQSDVNEYVDYSYYFGDEKAKDKDADIEHQRDSIVLGKAEDRLINDLKKYYGIDFSQAYHYLRDNNIRHIRKSHGEGTKEKYPVTTDDIKQIPDIISNYDDVYYIKHPDGREGLYYVKRHNGTTYYLEGVYDKYKTLVNFQMIKASTGTVPTIPLLEAEIKKRNSFLTRNGNNTPSAYVQDVQGNVPKDNIPHNKSNVNMVSADTVVNQAYKVINEKLEEVKVYQKAYKDFVDNLMLYRTFQDDNFVSRFSEAVRAAFNIAGFGKRDDSKVKFSHEFGLGDYFNPYAKVGGNVINRFIEYSPLGVIKTVYDICDAVKTIKSGEKEIARFKDMPEVLNGVDKANIRVDEITAKNKAYKSLAKGLEAGMLIWAGYALAASGVITGAPSAGAEEDFEQARNNDSYGLNFSMLKRYLNGDFTEGTHQDDYVMNIAWLSPVFTLMSVGAYCADKDNEKRNIIENLMFGSGNALWEQVNALSLFSNINRTINNFKYADDWKDGAVATLTDMLLVCEPSILRQYGNAVDDYARDPYHGENMWQTAWNRYISRSPIKALRENVPMRIDIFGQAKKTTLGNKYLDFLNNMILPGTVTQYRTNDVAEYIEKLAGGDEEIYDRIIPKTPYRSYTGQLEDGTEYSFELNDKDYERYANLLGMTAYKAMENFVANGDAEKYLTKSQQIDALEEISLNASYEVEEIWAKYKTGKNDITLEKEVEEYVDSTSFIATNLVKSNTAKAYVQTDGVLVEDVIDTGYYVPYTEDEKAKAIQTQYSYIDKVRAGKWKNNDGVYSSQWSEAEKQKVIEDFENDAERIANGTEKRWQKITGTWDELTDEEKGIVLRNITKYPDEVTLPDDTGFLVQTEDAEPLDITDKNSNDARIFNPEWDAAEYDRTKEEKEHPYVPSNSSVTDSKGVEDYLNDGNGKDPSGGGYSGYKTNYSKGKNYGSGSGYRYTPRVVSDLPKSSKFKPRFGNQYGGRFGNRFGGR